MNRPSSLDALAFGFLSLHAIPCLQNPKLFSNLSFVAPNLLHFVDKIQKNQFSSPFEKVEPESFSWKQSLTQFVDLLQKKVFSFRNKQNGSKNTEEEWDEKALVQERISNFYRLLSVTGAMSVFVFFSLRKH
jgi:hypothetical protein